MEEWKHPDPGWWKRAPMSKSASPFDLCDECGHVRFLHGKGCMSTSASLDAPRGYGCICSNTATSNRWHQPVSVMTG